MERHQRQSFQQSAHFNSRSPNDIQHLHQPAFLGHKVHIIDCAACGQFLSNRGMKAVLLLRPNVALYSTDALPVNCSAYSEATPAKSCTEPSPRTCSCLTQTLLCHGCGNPVGYMIVIPCELCTSSTSTGSRTTNNHRFVFHCGVVQAFERLHIEDDPQVRRAYQPNLTFMSNQTISSNHNRILSSDPANPLESNAASHEIRPSLSFATINDITARSYLPTPPPDDLEGDDGVPDMASAVFSSPPQGSPRSFPLTEHSISSPIAVRAQPTGSNPAAFLARLATVDQTLQSLAVGDSLFWHHLTRHGEIPSCVDSLRARGKPADS